MNTKPERADAPIMASRHLVFVMRDGVEHRIGTVIRGSKGWKFITRSPCLSPASTARAYKSPEGALRKHPNYFIK